MERQLRSPLGGRNRLVYERLLRVTAKVQLKQSQVAQYCGQDIVEVVGDPAGQDANGLHLGRVLQRLLHPMALSHVPENEHGTYPLAGDIRHRNKPALDEPHSVPAALYERLRRDFRLEPSLKDIAHPE